MFLWKLKGQKKEGKLIIDKIGMHLQGLFLQEDLIDSDMISAM